MHALSTEHSELTVHSGRQPGGLPKYPGKQEQTETSPLDLHWLFGPHGDGIHGLLGSSDAGDSKHLTVKKKRSKIQQIMLTFIDQSNGTVRVCVANEARHTDT